MKITRDVILDLLPLYLAGEVSPATRELVEEYLAQDPELAEQARSSPELLAHTTPPSPPPELELKALSRTRRLIAVQTWLFGFAISFTAVGLALRITLHEGQFPQIQLEILQHPMQLGLCLLIGAAFWAGYFAMKWRLRV
jgi:hypothetical protein